MGPLTPPLWSGSSNKNKPPLSLQFVYNKSRFLSPSFLSLAIGSTGNCSSSRSVLCIPGAHCAIVPPRHWQGARHCHCLHQQWAPLCPPREGGASLPRRRRRARPPPSQALSWSQKGRASSEISLLTNPKPAPQRRCQRPHSGCRGALQRASPGSPLLLQPRMCSRTYPAC
jgi:hypothetical protein